MVTSPRSSTDSSRMSCRASAWSSNVQSPVIRFRPVRSFVAMGGTIIKPRATVAACEMAEGVEAGAERNRVTPARGAVTAPGGAGG